MSDDEKDEATIDQIGSVTRFTGWAALAAIADLLAIARRRGAEIARLREALSGRTQHDARAVAIEEAARCLESHGDEALASSKQLLASGDRKDAIDAQVLGLLVRGLAAPIRALSTLPPTHVVIERRVLKELFSLYCDYLGPEADESHWQELTNAVRRALGSEPAP